MKQKRVSVRQNSFSSRGKVDRGIALETVVEEEEKKTSTPKRKGSGEVSSPQKKGKSLEDFEILGIIGEGAFGTVYHVVQKEDGKQFAIKTITKSKVKSKEEMGAIMRERKILAMMDHPNVIGLKGGF